MRTRKTTTETAPQLLDSSSVRVYARRMINYRNQYLTDPGNNFSPSTVQSLRYVLDRLPGVPADVTVDDVISAVTGGGPSDSTMKRRLTAYRSYFEWCQWLGYCDFNPAKEAARRLKLKPQRVVQANWLTRDMVTMLLEELPDDTPVDRRNLILFRIGFSTGLRRSELAKLRWTDIDLETGRTVVVGKGGKLATVRIPAGLLPMLSDWKRTEGGYVLPAIRLVRNFFEDESVYEIQWDTPLAPSTISRIVKKASLDAGYPIATHDMRRTFAGLANEQLGIEETSVLLRHSNIGTTQVYLETRQDAGYEAGKRLGLDF